MDPHVAPGVAVKRGLAGVLTTLCGVLVALSLGAGGACAQGPWAPGARAAALFSLEEGGPGLGWHVAAFMARSQTPRVDIDVEGGFLWFPQDVRRFVFSGPGGGTVREVRSEEMAGPAVSLGAARPVRLGEARLEVGARVGVALLRERSRLTSDRPDVVPPYEVVDWEVSPIWTVGSTLLLPETAWPGGRPRLDARLSVITLAGDGFIPVISVGAGWSGADS